MPRHLGKYVSMRSPQADSHACQHPSIHRRQFLAAGLALGAGGVIGGSAAAGPTPLALPVSAVNPPAKHLRRVPGFCVSLSCAGYSFRRHLSGSREPAMTLDGFIDFCAKHDLDGAELTSYYFKRTDREYLLSLKRRAFLNGLKITGTPIRSNFCLPRGEARTKELQHVKRWIDIAALLDAPCIRVFSGGPPKGETEQRAREWCIEGLREACEHAGEKGVVLALENHGGISETAEQLALLVEGTDSPWLGVNLDTGNFHKDAYAEIERAAPLAVVVQHKVELRGEDGSKVPADFSRILKILQAASFRGVIALEYEAAGDPFKEVPRYLTAMKRAIREISP